MCLISYSYLSGLVHCRTLRGNFEPSVGSHTLMLPFLSNVCAVTILQSVLSVLVGGSYVTKCFHKKNSSRDKTVQVVLTDTVMQFHFFLSLNMFCRIIWVYLSVGIWVYPLLAHFSTPGLVGLFFFNMSVVVLLYLLGNKLNSHFWSKTH